MTNHLSNLFANIKNGQMAKKTVILESRKNIYESFLKMLWDEGFISGYRISSRNEKKIEIFLKYTKEGKPAITSLKCLSRPGQRLYFSTRQIWKLDSSKIFIIFSTNIGLKTINQCKKNQVGGEPLVLIK
jgi:small subunit ribosomal protein S8